MTKLNELLKSATLVDPATAERGTAFLFVKAGVFNTSKPNAHMGRSIGGDMSGHYLSCAEFENTVLIGGVTLDDIRSAMIQDEQPEADPNAWRPMSTARQVRDGRHVLLMPHADTIIDFEKYPPLQAADGSCIGSWNRAERTWEISSNADNLKKDLWTDLINDDFEGWKPLPDRALKDILAPKMEMVSIDVSMTVAPVPKDVLSRNGLFVAETSGNWEQVPYVGTDEPASYDLKVIVEDVFSVGPQVEYTAEGKPEWKLPSDVAALAKHGAASTVSAYYEPGDPLEVPKGAHTAPIQDHAEAANSNPF